VPLSDLRSLVDQQHWEDLGRQAPPSTTAELWRQHADSVNAAFIEHCLRGRRFVRALKTDAFEEAMGGGLATWLAERAQGVYCMDVAPSILQQARHRHPDLAAIMLAADARQLPLRSSGVDLVISTSTLDHFETAEDLERSLEELTRVLRPGGELVITLDNPAHPLLWLRSRMLPQLRTLGVVPYFVGVSWKAGELRGWLQSRGWQVLECRTLLHCPRVLAVPLCRLAARLGRTASRGLLSALQAHEALAHTPLANRTGHFIAVHARKPLDEEVSSVCTKAPRC
jgi:SAM-dependent methyltransferase